jgi:hypothetical protein
VKAKDSQKIPAVLQSSSNGLRTIDEVKGGSNGLWKQDPLREGAMGEIALELGTVGQAFVEKVGGVFVTTATEG